MIFDLCILLLCMHCSHYHLSSSLSLPGFPESAVKARVTQWRRALGDELAQSHAALGQTMMVNKLLLPEWRFGLTVAGTPFSFNTFCCQLCFPC